LSKSTYTGGKCRNTDRGLNKNVNTPFHSLLRGLAPETCIFIQVARKKVRLADLEKKLRSAAGIQIRQEKCSLSFSPMLFQWENQERPVYALSMLLNCLRVVSVLLET